jgi:hypothetical protein
MPPFSFISLEVIAMSIDPKKCVACQKPIKPKNGIEGDGNPYFVTCSECGVKNKIKQDSYGSGLPIQFSVSGLIDDRS